MQSSYSAGMKRYGLCMEERSPLWVRRSKSEETLCRLLITMVEETFDIRRSWVGHGKQIMNQMRLLNPIHFLFDFHKDSLSRTCHSFQLFLFSEELSNITYSCLLTLTVVRNLVRSNQLNVSRFVIHRQLMPSHVPEIPCRPSKGVPSERLR